MSPSENLVARCRMVWPIGSAALSNHPFCTKGVDRDEPTGDYAVGERGG
jgi:hypothetical protein